MNLFKDIRENYGQETVRSVRDLGRYGKKSPDITIILCLHSDVKSNALRHVASDSNVRSTRQKQGTSLIRHKNNYCVKGYGL